MGDKAMANAASGELRRDGNSEIRNRGKFPGGKGVLTKA